jgi:rubrerythrin
MKDNLPATLDDIISFAVRIEEESYSFYAAAGKEGKGGRPPEVVKLFKILALEEQNHKNILLRKIPRATAHSRLPEEPSAAARSIVELPKIAPEAELADVLLAAAGRERATARLYRSLMALSDFGDLQEVFAELVAQEEGHEKRLMSMHKSLYPQSTE